MNGKKEMILRKLTIYEHISLDGIIQAPGGPQEDPEHGFELGGWVVPHSSSELGVRVATAHMKTDFDLLLGRKTYDIWAAYWPKVENNPLSEAFNKAKKYVATHRPESMAWGPVHDLGADAAEGIRTIKSQQGPELILWGSSTLTPLLLDQGLADKVVLFVYPVLLGKGKRFFREGTPARELSLVESERIRSGVFINTYTPGVPARTGHFNEMCDSAQAD